MTDLVLLNKIIKDSGMTITAIAEKSNMNRQRLYSILQGVDVRAVEIQSLAKTLRLTNAIRDKVFFATKLSEE